MPVESEIAYKFRKSARARKLRLTVYCDGAVVVTMPRYASMYAVNRFINDKKEWILAKLAHFARMPARPIIRLGRADYLRYRERARLLIDERIAHLNRPYGYRVNAISIRNQKSRWGSCSKKGNLNFNFKLMFLPERVRDYVIVHELCHLREFNHSQRFWDLVAQSLPDYRSLRKSLRESPISLR